VLVVSAKWIARSAALLVIACTTSGQHAGQAPAAEASHARETQPSHAQLTQQRFLDMFARSYFPGRTGQLLIVPREGDFITRPDQDVPYMHGSPWAYDVAIPLIFVGPRSGSERIPRRPCSRTWHDTRGCAWRAYAANIDWPRIAGPEDGYGSTAGGRADRSRWHASRLLRSVRPAHANAHDTAAAWGMVHSGAAQYSSVEYRGGALHHCHRNRSRRTWVTGTNVYDRIGRVRHEIFAGAEPGT